MGIHTQLSTVEYTIRLEDGLTTYPLVSRVYKAKPGETGWYPTIKLAVDEFVKHYSSASHFPAASIDKRIIQTTIETIETPAYLQEQITKNKTTQTC
jgi:hypothetical protein